MANTHASLGSLFTSIANAIREKTGSTAEIVADDFPAEIEKIETGFDYVNDSVETIPALAFRSCKQLRSVDCSKVSSIGVRAFSRCTNLTSVNIEGVNTTINEFAFSSCSSLTHAVLPDSLTSLGIGAFQDCTSLSSIVIPSHVTNINTQSFYQCSSLSSVSIPNSVTAIGGSAFEGCCLNSIIYSGTVDQWLAISKKVTWDTNTPDYTIHCTDGDIAKDGTITYKEG